MKWNGIVDFSKSVTNSSGNVQFHVVHKGTSFPTVPSPQEGQLFFRTDLDTLYAFDGSIWNKSVNGITASDVPVADGGGNWTSTNVEGVLDEIDGRLDTLELPAAISKWNEAASILTPKTTNGILNITTNGSIGDSVTIVNSAGSNDSLFVNNAGTGNGIYVSQTGEAIGINCIGTQTTARTASITNTAATTIACLYTANSNASATGQVIQAVNAGTGNALDINQTGVNTVSSYGVKVVSAAAQINSPLAYLNLSSGSSTQPVIEVVQAGTGAGIKVDGGILFTNDVTGIATNGGLRYTSGNGFEGYHGGAWSPLGGSNIFTSGAIYIGDNTTTVDKNIWANNGDANEPYVRYDESANKWVVSNDGVAEVDVGGGGTTAYKVSFTNASLSSGILTVTHSLNEDYVTVVIYDNNKKVIIPDEITSSTANITLIDLTSYGTIAGTWNVRCI